VEVFRKDSDGPWDRLGEDHLIVEKITDDAILLISTIILRPCYWYHQLLWRTIGSRLKSIVKQASKA
jgi:hypothetical protein